MAGSTGTSQYMESLILGWLKGTAFPATLANTYVALFTTAPTDDSGAGAVEVSGNAYAREAVASSNWGAISGGLSTPSQISNGTAVTFPTPTGSWGTIVAIGLYDASSAGHLLYWNTIASQVINSGFVASFAAGALVITQD